LNVDNNNVIDGYCCISIGCPNIGHGWKKLSDFSEHWISEYLQTSNNNLFDLSKRGIVNILLYSFLSYDGIIFPIISIRAT